ncbi:MAG: quinone-dependent dihydroorotate dehydrogenase, partial [Anaerolineales bacterium]
MYAKFLRPFLFRFDPELAHDATIQLLRLVGSFYPVYYLLDKCYNAHSHYTQSNKSKINILGLQFTNKIGLAAGYDKDGLAWKGLTVFGFGHIEVGTVTPRAQSGNPKPRIFRIPDESSVINRMGFPGKGAEFVARQISARKTQRSSAILGVNIGKNKDTPNEDAAGDYLSLLEKFSGLADYIAVNVSSPNTVGLRRLQARDNLESLLNQLATKRSNLSNSPPILVKLAPDLSDIELDDALTAILNSGMDGIIATNTTLDHSGLKFPSKMQTGGLSGAALTTLSQNIVRKISLKISNQLPIIGVGGIMNSDDAKRMLDSGASLI